METILNGPSGAAGDRSRGAGGRRTPHRGIRRKRGRLIQGSSRERRPTPLTCRRALLEKGIHQHAERVRSSGKCPRTFSSRWDPESPEQLHDREPGAHRREPAQGASAPARGTTCRLPVGNLVKAVDRGQRESVPRVADDDLDRLLNALPVLNSDGYGTSPHSAAFASDDRARQGRGRGVPGRAGGSQPRRLEPGGYAPGSTGRTRRREGTGRSTRPYESIGLTDASALDRLLYAPALSASIPLPELEVKT